ncbi:MAG: alpha/beta hydrolase [Verrucomicrobia bacterium]|nr:alpha/beta hydrolase [Verrucomicrobiota bacterium]
MSSAPLEPLKAKLRAMMATPATTIGAFRAVFNAFSADYYRGVGAQATPIDAGGVPAEWIVAPGVSSDRVIYFLHGGGYVIGSVSTHRDCIERLSLAANARVLAPEYRLGPEHPFPAAVEDALAAYRWLLAQGVNPRRFAICGDSAGGGLSLATLVQARAAGLVLPAATALMCPWIDLECTGSTMATNAATDPMVQKPGLLGMAQMYLAGNDPRAPLASPLHADLAGLPPLLIQAGGAESLLDDSLRLAAKAKAAGVEVALEVWPDMIHVWQLFASTLAEGQQAIDQIGQYLQAKTAG